MLTADSNYTVVMLILQSLNFQGWLIQDPRSCKLYARKAAEGGGEA